MKKWLKKDFRIVWERSGSRLFPINANVGFWEVYWNGKHIYGGFPTKAMADDWLTDFLKKANNLRKQAAEKGIID